MEGLLFFTPPNLILTINGIKKLRQKEKTILMNRRKMVRLRTIPYLLLILLLGTCIHGTSESIGMQQSVQFVLQYLLQHGPFDGLMGFSQGAAMVTRIAMLVLEQHCAALPSLRFLILIGGVQPMETRFTFLKVTKRDLFPFIQNYFANIA